MRVGSATDFTVNSSLFQTAKDESEQDRNHGPDGQFQTALLSSIGDLEMDMKGHTQNLDSEQFEETNIFKSNFEVQDDQDEAEFMIDGSTILNN